MYDFFFSTRLLQRALKFDNIVQDVNLLLEHLYILAFRGAIVILTLGSFALLVSRFLGEFYAFKLFLGLVVCILVGLLHLVILESDDSR